MAFFLSLMEAFKEIFTAPFLEPRLWWQLAPVFLLWFVLDIYFASHEAEELGWNSALANAITLFWITLAALQPLFLRKLGESFLWGNFWMIFLFLGYAIFLGVISFKHLFGSRVTYILATPTITYYLCAFAILWGNKALPVNKWMLLAFLLLWIVILGIRWVLFRLLPDEY